MGLTDNITNEIIIMSTILKTNNVSRVAESVGYKPLLIMNALYKGNADGKISYNSKRDTFSISEDVVPEKLAITETMVELTEQVEMFIGYMNVEKKDITIDELQLFLAGTPEQYIKLAVFSSDKLASYELAQPGDKKSVYTFVTLKDNLAHQWGKKQFNNKTGE